MHSFYLSMMSFIKLFLNIWYFFINIPKCVEKWYNGTDEAIVKWANIFMAENLEETRDWWEI